MGIKKTIERFEAPQSYEEVCNLGGQGSIDLQDVSSSRKEIWLIKAPANFDGKKLNGVTLNFHGDPVEFPTDDERSYEAVSVTTFKENEETSPYLLLPSREENTVLPAPGFKGQITIVESLNVPPSNRLPDIEPSKAPEMPEGLRQRFKPFGWEEPLHDSSQSSHASPTSALGHSSRKEAGDGGASHSSFETGSGARESDSHAALESQTGSKKMKRKQKKEEIDEAEAEEQSTEAAGEISRPKKKKKKNKDKKM